MKTIEQYWTETVSNALVGRRIKTVFYDGYDDWSQLGVNLELDDGTVVFLQSDDEGNGPAAVLIAQGEKTIYGPVLHRSDCKTNYNGGNA